jgi:glycosyltransferase involved in cell wall biosynthesis
MHSASVIICSHNPRPEYLRRTLESLKGQTLDSGEWELIVVDNRSEPPLEGRVDLAWHPDARIVREENLGLTHARLAGIRLSKGEVLVFVDDDNVLAPDFLETALRVADEKPFLGSWSGQCKPEFETTPPEWTRRYWGNLVIREFDTDTWSNLPRLPDSMPCGAGLCVRRNVAMQYVHLHESGQRELLLDRTGDSLLSGGDNDLAACACDIGLGVGLISSLSLTHLIPRERLTADYLERLVEGIYTSSVILDWQRSRHRAHDSFSRRAIDFARALSAGEPHRRILLAAQRGRQAGLERIEALDSRRLDG